MSTMLPDTTTTGVRACLFVLGNQRFAVEVRYAQEVVVLEDHTIVPRSPSHLIGVTNLRGQILPVLDIRPLLGLPAGRVGRGTRALVVEASPLQVAVAVDGVQGLASFDGVLPFGEAVRREYGEVGVGLLEWGEGLATLLDVPKILEALRVEAVGTGSDGS